MIIPDFNELTFNEEGHIYTLNGVEVPSVTTLMKPLSSKVYGDINQDALDKAAARGTAVHEAIETWTKYGIMDVQEEVSGYFDAFLSWWNKARPELIANEHKVYHKLLNYAGTVDMIAVVDGIPTIIDFKTSYKVQKSLCAIQLEAYQRAFESHGIQLNRRLILHMKKDGKYKEYDFFKDSKVWSVFSALLTIDNYQRSSIA